jgi:hypothetical protein
MKSMHANGQKGAQNPKSVEMGREKNLVREENCAPASPYLVDAIGRIQEILQPLYRYKVQHAEESRRRVLQKPCMKEDVEVVRDLWRGATRKRAKGLAEEQMAYQGG